MSDTVLALPLDRKEIANIIMHYKKMEDDIFGYVRDEALDIFIKEYKHIFGIIFRTVSYSLNSNAKDPLFSINVSNKVDIDEANKELGLFLSSIGVNHRIEPRCYH